jgi:D-glycero-D-manno-heptose 1,7-bisphosphate phosphatase
LKTPLHAAVFLDRDGTLIREKHYLHRPEEVEFFPGTTEALRSLQAAGLKLVLVTNQSGVGRGLFSLEDVEKVHAYICSELAQGGARFERIYVAPEHPDQPSRGRKPSPQFLFEARDELAIDLSQSYFIGDKLIDLECGWNAGVRKSILVRTGYGLDLEKGQLPRISQAVVVDNLPQAAQWILNDHFAGSATLSQTEKRR